MRNVVVDLSKFEGYELAYFAESSSGSHSRGLAILVKMSDRKICDKDDFYKAAEMIRTGLDTVSAELDPNGPEERERYRAEIVEIYKVAGIEAIYMEQLPNGYCSRPCCLNRPWFRVTSRIGHVVIGWRRRVISIDWKDSMVKATGEELFPVELVTRFETGIHAWDALKAAEYIARLHQS